MMKIRYHAEMTRLPFKKLSAAKPVHVMYIPGLGDKYDPFRAWALRWWSYRNVSVELIPMRWESDESYLDKIHRLEQRIAKHPMENVVLLGESAGGSVVVAMHHKYRDTIGGVMTICGKNRNAHTVSPVLYRKNPSFRQSMQAADTARESLEKWDRFVSIHPVYDAIVPIRETLLPHCREVTLYSVGHFATIVLALTISSWRVVRTARMLRTENM